jgi:hypothetical protein
MPSKPTYPKEILVPLEEAWNDIVEALRGYCKERPYWSEKDLIHAVAVQLENKLREHGITGLHVHVAPSLSPELFEGRLKEGLEKLGGGRKEPDLIVHESSDVENPFLLR